MTGLPSPLAITAERLRAFAPGCDVAAVAPALDAACAAHAITTLNRVRHFLAHTHVESMGFTKLQENLSYSAQRLVQVWPARFPNLVAATPYAHNPQALAEKVYGGRLGNNVAGDGWRYRGSAYIQVTGRSNFGMVAALVGADFVSNPDLLRTPGYAALAAAAWWEHAGLNALADRDDVAGVTAGLARLTALELDLVKQETRTVNGGLNGLEARDEQLLNACRIWPG